MRRAVGCGGLVFAAALALAAPATRAPAQPRLAADPSLTTSDTALLKDETRAIAEFRRRLRAQVTYRDGVLVIVDRSGTTSGVTVMPANVLWGVDCSDGGLGVTFGSGNGDTDNGVALQLTPAALSDEQCLRIAPAIGTAMLDIAKGN